MEYYEAIESGEEYLSHHGVKGQKWGIRHDPERIGRVRKAIAKVGGITIRGLKRAGTSAYRTAKRASYRRTQRKIDNAIASGQAERINKVFSKMNDSQAQRAVMRMNQRDSVYRSRIEAGKRSLANAKLQKKVDNLKLRNEYQKVKHPTLYKEKQRLADDLTRNLERRVEKGASYIGTAIISSSTESGAVKSTAKQAAKSTTNVVYRGRNLNVRRLGHSDINGGA